jgi:cell division protein FtsB
VLIAHAVLSDTWDDLRQAVDEGVKRPKALSPESKNTKRSLQLPAIAEAARERIAMWRRRAATVGFGSLALVMAYGVVFGHNGLTAYAHKRSEESSLQQQMQQLQKENDRLQGHVERLQNDPGAIEHQAREQLHYTRAGEVIYTLPAPKTEPAQPQTPAK